MDDAKAILAKSDLIGISIYPFMYLGSLSNVSGIWTGDADPSVYPADWLAALTNLAVNKKLAICETGFVAEDLDLSTFNLYKKGSPEWQSNYVERLLGGCQDLHAEFVVYWEIRDYDAGWAWLQAHGISNQLVSTWKDTGLIDGAGNPRPALTLWQSWLTRSRQP